MERQTEIARIRAAVAGIDPSIPRADAMQQLVAANAPDADRDLANVLQNTAEDVQVRSLAATSLARLKSTVAAQALLSAIAAPSPTLATVALRGLGRIAGPEALPAIEQLANRSSGAVARQARFAATLIAHRFNLPGRDTQLPPASDFLTLSAETAESVPIRVAEAAPTEVAAALASMSREPVGVPLSPHAGWKIVCHGFEWMLLLNEEFAAPGALEGLAARKAVPAIVAVKGMESGEYRPALTVLTSSGPSPQAIDVLLYELSGELAYAGPGTIVPRGVRVTLQSVREGAVLPTAIEGTFDGRSFSVSNAVTAASIPSVRRRSPRPLTALGEAANSRVR
jgi:hypothetical protein